MKTSSDTIGNGTRVLPACSAVAQPIAPPAACPKNPGGDEIKFSLFQNIHTGSGINLAPYSMGTGGSLPGLRQQGLEADTSI